MDYGHLLFVLERVKAACRHEYGVFHTFGEAEDDADAAACALLEKKGLIKRAGEEPGHVLWVLAE